MCCLTALVAVVGCTPSARQGAETGSAEQELTDSADFAYPVQVEYAKGFAVRNHPDYKELVIYSPGTQDTLAYYILYPRWHPAPTPPKGGYPPKLIPVPARTLACASSTEIGALPILDLRDKLVACSNPTYIYDSIIRERMHSGLVETIGQGMSRNVEQIIALAPDVYLQDMYTARDKEEEIVRSGVNIVYYNNWKEQSLLGRTEWFKIMGLLFGRNAKAGEAFGGMVERYKAVQRLAQQADSVTPVMYGKDYKGVWYVPGEYAYITNMFADAKVSYDYIAGELDNKPMSFEYVFSRHQHKRIWLCLMAGDVRTREDFLGQNERYRDFEAAKSGEIWVDRKRASKQGGNDFWEGGPYHPDLLLKDIVKIAHPELLPSYETTYWTKLTD